MNTTAQNIIAKVVPYFKTQPINAAYLFGSFSRNEGRKDSDVDLLVIFDKITPVSLFKISQMNIDLENILKRKVDLVSEGSLKDYVAKSIENDKILIYERACS